MTRLGRQYFGKRVPLHPGCTSFGGRDRLDTLLSTIFGVDGANSVSIVGPRQSGRSSLVQQLSHPEAVHPYDKCGSSVVAQVDFRPFKGRPAEAMRGVVDAIAAALGRRGVESTRVAAQDSVTAAVGAALELVAGTLVIAIDDFDQVASDLTKDDQGDLRAAVYRRSRAAYVLVSRLPLSHCLEGFGDDMSDLARSCVPVANLVAPLSPAEIIDMVRRRVPDCSLEVARQVVSKVHFEVGGFPLFIQQALAVAFAPTADVSNSEFVNQAGRALAEALPEQIEDDLLRSFRRLSGPARSCLTNGVEHASGDVLRELRSTGWLVLNAGEITVAGAALARWARSATWTSGRLNPNPADQDDRYDQLVKVVAELNEQHRRNSVKKKEKILRQDVFESYRDVPYLRRRVVRVEDFGRKVISLARLLYEGSGGGVRDAKLKLPRACYEDRRSVVFQVARLRHAWVHLEHPDDRQAERNIDEEAAVYERYTGERAPVAIELLANMGDALMDETIRLLSALREKCPFAEDLDLEPILCNAFGEPGADGSRIK